jgi:hypothetical protein
MVNAEKLGSISLLLIGIVFLLQAIAIMYGLVAVSYYGSPVSGFTTIIVVGWIYAILLFITGLLCLLASGANLIGK